MSLVAKLALRDDGAWRHFLSLYSPLVVCWCKRKNVARHDIDDLAQDVFREVVGSVSQFRKGEAGGSFRGWLCRIVHRRIADHFRRQQPIAEGGTPVVEQVETFEEAEDEVLAETSYLYQRAVNVIRGEFNDKTWDIFWRLVVDERTATEVAAEQQMTSAAVRQIKSRVFRRLKQVVGDFPE